MKILLLLIITLNCLAAPEYLFEKGSYEVVGKVSEIKNKSVVLEVFQDTTSQSSLVLQNVENLKLGKIKIKLCVEVDQACNWKCSGKLKKVVEPIAPWTKISLNNAIRKVDNCL